MDEEERTTAIGLARYSREFFDAARGADRAIGRRPGYELHAPMPVMFLTAHAIELGLKAYLRYRGYSLKQLKTQGHNLAELWREAVTVNIATHVVLTEEEVGILHLINELHMSTELRYIRTGPKTVPVFGPLSQLTTKLLDKICPLVGYR